MAFKLELVSDVKSVLRDTKTVGERLDDVADALDDVGRDGKNAGRDVERALDDVADGAKDAGRKLDDLGDDARTSLRKAEDSAKDTSRALDDLGDDARSAGDDLGTKIEAGAREAGDSADTLEKKFRDALKEVRTDAKKTGDTVAKETDSGTSTAGAFVGDFKDEAISNFSEVASSFSGDMTSAVDGVQGLLGGLASSSIPGVGIAAGLAGLAMGAAFADAQEEAELTRERIDAIKQAFADSESAIEATGKVWREQIESWADPMKVLGDDVVGATKKLEGMGFVGDEVDTIIRGMAGSPEDMNKALDLMNRKLDLINADLVTADGKSVDWLKAMETVDMEKVRDELDKTKSVLERATAEYERQQELVEDIPQSLRDAIQKINDRPPAVVITPELDMRTINAQIRAWRPTATVNPRLGQQVK